MKFQVFPHQYSNFSTLQDIFITYKLDNSLLINESFRINQKDKQVLFYILLIKTICFNENQHLVDYIIQCQINSIFQNYLFQIVRISQLQKNMELSAQNAFQVIFPKYVELLTQSPLHANEDLQTFIRDELPQKIQLVRSIQPTFLTFQTQFTNLILKRPKQQNLIQSLVVKASEKIDKYFFGLQVANDKQVNKHSLDNQLSFLNLQQIRIQFRQKLKSLNSILKQKYFDNYQIQRLVEEEIARRLYSLNQIFYFLKNDISSVASKFRVKEHQILNDINKNSPNSQNTKQIHDLLFLEDRFLENIHQIVDKRCRPFLGKKDFFYSKVKQIQNETQSKVPININGLIQSILAKQKYRVSKELASGLTKELKTIDESVQEQLQKQCKQIITEVDALKKEFNQLKNNIFYVDIIRGSFGQKYKMELNKLQNIYYLSNIQKYLQDIQTFTQKLIRVEQKIINNRKSFMKRLGREIEQKIIGLVTQYELKNSNNNLTLKEVIQNEFKALEDSLYGIIAHENVRNQPKNNSADEARKKRLEQAEDRRKQLEYQKQQKQRVRRQQLQDKAQQQRIKRQQDKIKLQQKRRAQDQRIRKMREQRDDKERIRKMQQQQKERIKKIQMEDKLKQKKNKDQFDKQKLKEQIRRKQEEKRKKQIEDAKLRQRMKADKQDEQRRKKQQLDTKKRQMQEDKRRKQQQQRNDDEKLKKQRQDKQRQQRQDQQRVDRQRRSNQQKQKQRRLQQQKQQKQRKQRKENQLKSQQQRDQLQRRQKQQRQETLERQKRQRIQRQQKQKVQKQKQRLAELQKQKRQAQQREKNRTAQLDKQKRQKQLKQLKQKQERQKRQRQEKQRKQRQNRQREQKQKQRQQNLKKQAKQKEQKQKKQKEQKQRKQRQLKEKKQRQERQHKQRQERQRKQRQQKEADEKVQRQKKQKQKRQKEQRQRKQLQLLLQQQQNLKKNKSKVTDKSKKGSGINYNDFDDIIDDDLDEIDQKQSKVSKKKPKNEDDQYGDDYDDDFESPEKQAQEGQQQVSGTQIQPKQLITAESIKCLNDYIKGTSYARKNKPNLEPFNNKDYYTYIFQEFIEAKKIYIFDSAVSKALFDFSKELQDENAQQDDLKMTIQTIKEEMLNDYASKVGEEDFYPRTVLILPFSFENQFDIKLIEFLPAHGWFRPVLGKQFQDEQAEQKFNHVLEALLHVFEIQTEPTVETLIINQQSSAVLSTFDKQLPCLLTLFALHYECELKGQSFSVTQYTVERFFYAAHILKPFYESIQQNEQILVKFYEETIQKYESNDDISIMMLIIESTDPDYEAKLQQHSVHVKQEFLKNKKQKALLIMFQILLVGEVQDQQQQPAVQKITIYSSLQRVTGNPKPIVTYFIITKDQTEKQNASTLFDIVSEGDGEFDVNVFMDYSRHNGLTQYSDWTLPLWARTIQKRKLNVITAFRAITFAMSPYFIAYKQQD